MLKDKTEYQMRESLSMAKPLDTFRYEILTVTSIPES